MTYNVRRDRPVPRTGHKPSQTVPGAGLEPACPLGRAGLSGLCLPFHHPGGGRPHGCTGVLQHHEHISARLSSVRTVEPGRASYRQVFAMREFRAIFLAYGLSILGDQVARIAVSLLVFQRSHSALAATATFAVSFAPGVIAGPLLSTLADRFPRRTVMIICDLLRVVLLIGLALPGLPLPVAFVVLLAVGLLEPPFESARGALLPEVLTPDNYVVASGVLQIVGQGGQVLGYLVGGALVAATSVQGALLLDATSFAVSAGLLLGLRSRPAALAPDERHSLIADTVAGARYVLGEPALRRLLGLALLGAATMIVPEGLAVPVAASLHGGPVAAGVLTAAVPAGFVLGSVLLLRIDVQRRQRLLVPLLVGSCLPLLLTPVTGSLSAIAALWVLSGGCSALQMIANAAYVAATPPSFRGRAFGIAGTSLYAVQGLAVLVGGGIADVLHDARWSVAGLGGLVLLGAMTFMLRADHPMGAQEHTEVAR